MAVNNSILTETFVGFPVLIIALIPLRWKILPMLFTAKELGVMDAPTADNEVVLASLGGKPQIPEDKEHAGGESPGTKQSSDNTINDTEEDNWSAAERGVSQQGMRERASVRKER